MIDQGFISTERQRSERFMGITFALMAWGSLAGTLVLARGGTDMGLPPEVAEGAALAFLLTAIANTALLFLWNRLAGARTENRG